MIFLQTTIEMIKREPIIFIVFFISSLLLALTEGLTISLLIPILDAGGSGTNFTNIPLIGNLLEPVIALPSRERFILISIILSIVLIFRGLLQFTSIFIGSLLSLRLQCIIVRRVHDLLLRCQLNYIHTKKHGDLKTLMQEHPVRVATTMRSLAEIFGALALIGIYFLIMLTISPPMTLASACFAGLMVLVFRKLSESRLRLAGSRLSDSMNKIHNLFFEMIQGVKLIRLSNAEKLSSRLFNEAIDQYYRIDLKRNFISGLHTPLFLTIAGLFICVLLAIGSMLHEENDTSWVLMLLLFIICLYRMLNPVSVIIHS